ncbi:anti-sigma factor family protein [Cypionkella sp.]|uniref:anti-sigma factor family protein n=1 Tax=Cypionkella sp. TaxID=2811411 RepID=UPI002ABC4FEB|nr:zf-HC2 domain-containing protein [Cypionkella sp.]MDZ4392878.1 zf-HC2 domain-containing protein [Cypionkella sp.]
MNRSTILDKDRLAAFVDGEMSPEDAAAVVMHLADNPQDQAYVDDLMATNSALAQAFSAPLFEPVPAHLHDLILGSVAEDKVVRFRPKSVTRGGILLLSGLATGAALAASLVLAVFLPAIDANKLALGPLTTDSPLHQVLASLPSGTVQTMANGAEVMILSSLPTTNGFCREVEVIHVEAQLLEAALACTEGAAWTIEVIITEGLADATQAEGFATASGAEAQSFTPFLDRIGAGTFLSSEEESNAIARRWTK